MARKHPLPVRVSMKKDTKEFGYQFTLEGHRRVGSWGGSGSISTSGQQSPLNSPTVVLKRLSRFRGSQTNIPEEVASRTQAAKGYSFTSEILTFVTHQNPLLAAIIHSSVPFLPCLLPRLSRHPLAKQIGEVWRKIAPLVLALLVSHQRGRERGRRKRRVGGRHPCLVCVGPK